MSEKHVSVLIVGGGTGGVAAALGAAAMGCQVILTEETDWLGGQMTSQAVPPDEHWLIEQCGCTARYREYRDRVRGYYRENYPLTAEARAVRQLNPGGGTVSRLCHEPRVGVAVLEAMLASHRAAGRIEVWLQRKPVSAEAEGDRVRSVTLRHTETGEEETISADYILDATELGDLLPLAGVEYVSGAESQDEYGEPHAVAGPAEPDTVQAITWCFAAAYDPTPGVDYTIDKPAQYDFWRSYVPDLTPAWSGRLLSWTYSQPRTLEPIERVLFPWEADAQRPAIWPYRQIVKSSHFVPGTIPHDVTLVNWPQNDYWLGNIIDKPEEEVAKHLEGAKQLSLSLMYWMQTEAPRPDGGVGYPGLYLRPDMMGTEDGLAKYPYIRESRRIRAMFTVTENHVGRDARENRPPDLFEDSVGVGYYHLDLHPSTGGTNYIDFTSWPYQIPLGSLIPQRVENLLPACKNLGVTHVSNGCYRLHPTEWNIGESVGLLAGYCLKRGTKPRAVREDKKQLEEFQALLRKEGVELAWPVVYPE